MGEDLNIYASMYPLGMSTTIRRKVSIKKVKKCLKCGSLFDGDRCVCGSREYTDALAFTGG